MTQQKTVQQEIDFSIIDEHDKKNNGFDFSLESLVSEQDQQSSSKNKNTNTGQTAIEVVDSVVERRQLAPNGSFLRDLGKLEEQPSYQTQPYNVYNNELDITPYPLFYNNAGFTNRQITQRLKDSQVQDSYKYLILDFKPTMLRTSKLHNKKCPNKIGTTIKSNSQNKPSSLSNSNSKVKSVSSFKKNINIKLTSFTHYETEQSVKSKSKSKSKSKKSLKTPTVHYRQVKKSIEKNENYQQYFGYQSCKPLTFKKKANKIGQLTTERSSQSKSSKYSFSRENFVKKQQVRKDKKTNNKQIKNKL